MNLAIATADWETEDHKGPTQFAKRLATYISDPQRIRSLVVREYGQHRAPAVEFCARLRADYIRQREVFAADSAALKDYDPDNDNGEHFRVKGKGKALAPLHGKPVRIYDRTDGSTRTYTPAHVKVAFAEPSVIDGLVHNRILRSVADCFGMTVNQLIAKRRDVQGVAARQVAIRLLRDERLADGSYRFSLPHIGRIMGGRDHSTILHSLQTFDDKAKRFPEIPAAYAHIKAKLA